MIIEKAKCKTCKHTDRPFSIGAMGKSKGKQHKSCDRCLKKMREYNANRLLTDPIDIKWDKDIDNKWDDYYLFKDNK